MKVNQKFDRVGKQEAGDLVDELKKILTEAMKPEDTEWKLLQEDIAKRVFQLGSENFSGKSVNEIETNLNQVIAGIEKIVVEELEAKGLPTDSVGKVLLQLMMIARTCQTLITGIEMGSKVDQIT